MNKIKCKNCCYYNGDDCELYATVVKPTDACEDGETICPECSSFDMAFIRSTASNTAGIITVHYICDSCANEFTTEEVE